jgi:hypothetical protein
MKWLDLHNKKQPVYYSGNKPDDRFTEVMNEGKEQIKVTFLRIPIQGVKKLLRRLFS